MTFPQNFGHVIPVELWRHSRNVQNTPRTFAIDILASPHIHLSRFFTTFFSSASRESKLITTNVITITTNSPPHPLALHQTCPTSKPHHCIEICCTIATTAKTPTYCIRTELRKLWPRWRTTPTGWNTPHGPWRWRAETRTRTVRH